MRLGVGCISSWYKAGYRIRTKDTSKTSISQDSHRNDLWDLQAMEAHIYTGTIHTDCSELLIDPFQNAEVKQGWILSQIPLPVEKDETWTFGMRLALLPFDEKCNRSLGGRVWRKMHTTDFDSHQYKFIWNFKDIWEHAHLIAHNYVSMAIIYIHSSSC